MIHNKKILAVIPARGGSKGLPGKNIKHLAGKPLIAWTIEEAQKSKYIDCLVLSSDDEDIINIAKKYDCDVPFVRPAELALDGTPGIDPILHAMESLPGYDIVVVLQPTSPLRSLEDIDISIEKCFANGGHSVVTVKESSDNPYWMYELNEKSKMTSLLDPIEFPMRRQDAKKTYVLNGAVYVSGTEELKRERNFLQEHVIAHVMPSERSLDIDTEMDFKFCEMVIDNHWLR